MHSFQVTAFGKSDVGQKRFTNQDAFAIKEDPWLFAVADGIGGLQYGEIASEMAVDLFMQNASDFDLKDASGWQQLFGLIQESILQKALELGPNVSMGTTLTCGMIFGNTLFFGHVGDSVLYNCRQVSEELFLKRLTEEHTLAQAWVREHHLTEVPASLPNFYHHTLTHCLGQEASPVPQTGSYELLSGDRILCASDGIFYGWNETLLTNAIHQATDPVSLVEDLIKETNAQGGYDNVTAVALFVQ